MMQQRIAIYGKSERQIGERIQVQLGPRSGEYEIAEKPDENTTIAVLIHETPAK